MAARAAAAPTTRGTREGPAERLAEFVVLGGMATLAAGFVAPLALSGIPVWGALHALRRRSWRARGPVLALCALPAPTGLLWASVALGADPAAVANGYVDVQLDAAAAVVRAWPVTDWTPLLGAYGRAVWPYAVAGGATLGALANALHSLHRGSVPDERKGIEDEGGLVFRDAGEMAAAPERQLSWAVQRVIGRGVVSLLSAPPGLGKGWWTWGWLRAMQGGEDFFGLRVTRPSSTPRVVSRWFGAEPTPLKVLWLTEEGESFGETARRFGIRPGLVTVLQRQEVRTTDWPTIVARVKREAFRRGCAYVIIDTIRAWCPQAEQSNDQAAAVFNLARREWAARGLGVLFVHHDRKGGGEYGEGVAGPNNLVGSTDVLIELRRVKGDPAARRMLVSRRFGDQDVTARLEGVRYVVGTAPAGDQDAEAEAALPAVPAHLRATFEAIREAGSAGILRRDVQAVTRAADATLSRQCRELRGLGLIAEAGTGTKGAPFRYRLADASPAKAAPPTSDPEYVRYLTSKAWAAKRAEILDRADGVCEECGDEQGPGEAEVHHLTYARVFRELPEDLIALCPGCHRRAHSP